MRDVGKSKTCPPFLDVFARCARGMPGGRLIERENRHDKEFHFQNWFKARLTETRLHFEVGGRNAYPDFRLVATSDGFEVKGLAYPGARRITTATARLLRGVTMGERFTICSDGIRPSLTGTTIRCWT